MEKTLPNKIMLPDGGSAVQWQQHGDHKQVGTSWNMGALGCCRDCSRAIAEHGVLYGREPVKVCPGDWIISSPNLRDHTRLDPWTFEALYQAGSSRNNAVNEGARELWPEASEVHEEKPTLHVVPPPVSEEFLKSLPEPATIEEAIRQRNHWCECAAQHHNSEKFYHGLINEIGEMFGEAARTCDDGSVSDSILALRVPELVRMELSVQEANHAEIERLSRALASVRGAHPDKIRSQELIDMRRRLAEAESRCAGWAQKFDNLVQLNLRLDRRINELEANLRLSVVARAN